MRFFDGQVAHVLLAPLALGCSALVSCADAVKVERVTLGAATYRVARVSPADLELHWKNAAGQPYRSFDALRAALERRGRAPELIMNAGIFMEGGAPLGLHVQGGQTLRPLNTRRGYGNFYLQPNGVFLIEKGRARLVTTDVYARARPTPDLAVQSGPMLLVGGRVNAAFNPKSTSRLPRNGVGVDARGRVVLAVTEFGSVASFAEFAALFKKLGCENALFLDGNLSAMAVRDEPILTFANEYGAFFAVTKKR